MNLHEKLIELHETNDRDCGNTNEKTKLPITAILEERAKTYNQKNDNEKWGDYEVFIVQEIEEMLPQVRTLEESSQKKAKEEEKDRIIGILEDMLIMRGLENDYSKGKTFGLQEAITRIKFIS